ncbi:hypothetical protein [Streptomyces sp. NPDC002853]
MYRALDKGRAAGQRLTPEHEVSEVPDGSVPPEVPPERDAANR